MPIAFRCSSIYVQHDDGNPEGIATWAIHGDESRVVYLVCDGCLAGELTSLRDDAHQEVMAYSLHNSMGGLSEEGERILGQIKLDSDNQKEEYDEHQSIGDGGPE